jgi:hypothetical protein
MHIEPTTPGTAQPNPAPGTPTPEDPRENEPIHDPPVHEEHDIERDQPVRQANEGVESPNPSPDRVIFDENRKPT